MDGNVFDRDLNAISIPPINAEWVGSVLTVSGNSSVRSGREILQTDGTLIACKTAIS
jgi:hypothetical protein